MIETYLGKRRTLRLVVLILDIRHGPSDEDRQLIHWLRFYGLSFLVVLTKTDKLSGNQRRERLRRIDVDLDLPSGTAVIPFSAKTREGKDPLWREIERAMRLDTDKHL